MTPNWSVASSGTGPTVVWTNGDTAIFSAGTSASGNYTITLSGTQTAAGITFQSGAATLSSGTLTLNGSGAINVNSGIKGIISSVISGSVGLTKGSSGELVLAAANTFAGNLTNQAGTLTLNNSSAASSGLIVFGPSGANTAALTSSNASINIGNNVSVGNSSSATIEIDPLANNTLALSGVISGVHAWSANGPGTLVLGGSVANTFSGAFTVKQGTVVVAADGALGATGNGALVNSGATLALDGGVSYSTAKLVTLNGAGVGNNGAFRSLTGQNYFGGSITLNSDTTMSAAANSELFLGTPVNSSGTPNLTITDAGTVDLTGYPNNYNNTLVAAGTLEVDDPANAGNGLVTVNAGAALAGNGSAPGGITLSGAIDPNGTFSSGSQTWNGGGSYVWEIADAANPSANGLLNISGGLTNNATSIQKFTISIVSLDPNSYQSGVPGNFDNTQQYDWIIASAANGITGFDPSKFTINAASFESSLGGGSFRLLVSGVNMVLEFDPAPVISCPAPIVQGNDLNDCSATVSFAAAATNYANVEPVTISYQTNGVTITSPWVFPYGTTIVNATATDLVGDTAACSFTVTVNDAQPPSANVPANIVTTNDMGQCSAVVSFTLPAQTDNCGVAGQVATPASGSTFVVGTTPVTVVVTDIHGNAATNTFSVTVNDTEKPSVNVPANIVTTNDAGQCGAVVSFTLPDQTDNCGVATTVATPASDSTFSVGTTPVTVVVADIHGNRATNTFTVTVNDAEKPSANVPANIVTTNDAGQCGAVVSFTLPDQTDNCGVASTVATPTNGSTFPVGTNIVMVVVTDIHGSAATNTFTVTVNDTEKPSANVLANIVTTNDVGQCGAVVNFTLPDQTDNCGVASTVAAPASGSTFLVGTTPVTVVVTDIHGNAATNTFSVTVNDTEKPSANVPANIVTTNDAGQCGAVVSFTLPDQTDNCGVATTVATPASDSTFSVGTTPVTVVVADIHGNRATNTFTVTVNDVEKPSANVPANIVQENDPGQCSAVVGFTLPAQTDNCGVASTVATPTDGSTFPVGTNTVTVVVTDIHGNKATNTFTVTVNDTHPPVVTAWPSDQTLDVGGQCNVAVPNLTTAVVATDNCVTVNITQNPAVGTLVSLGTNNVIVTVTDKNGNSVSTNVVLTIIDTRPAPAATYVDDDYNGLPSGTVVKFPNGGSGADHYIGCDAFSTIQAGINRVAIDGTVTVAPGTYPEVLLVSQSVTLLGAQSGQNANTRFAAFTAGINGPKADPSVESVITAAAADPAGGANDSVHIMAGNVTIDGFVLDGNNPSLPQDSAVVVGGINTDTRRAIETEDASGNLFSANSAVIKNNIIQNYADRGVELSNPTAVSAATSGSLITGNVVGNFGVVGVLLAYNAYSDVTSNTVSMAVGSEAGIWLQDFSSSGATPKTLDWSHNTVTVCQDAFGGIWVNLFYASAAAINIHDNTVNAAAGVTGTDDYTYGIYLSSLRGGTTANLTNNIVGTSGGQLARGIVLWNLPTAAATTVSGGAISNALIGLSLSYDDENFGAAAGSSVANVSAATISGAGVGVLVEGANSGSITTKMQICGNTAVSASTTAIYVVGSDASANIHDNISSITGNSFGVSVDAGVARLENNDLTGNTTAAISLTNNAIVDAGNCSGVDVTGLGISSGGNNLSGYGFDDATPWAILNLNSGSTPAVLANHDNFGAAAGDNIPAAFYDPNAALVYSQSPEVFSAPTNVTVVCASDVPVGATDLAGLYALGGYYSAGTATVSYSDNTNITIGSGVITRTYTVTDACSAQSIASQTITVSDTIPPVVTPLPNLTLSADLGTCSKSNVTWTVIASDNCVLASVVSIPPSGSTFEVGSSTVTNIATDTSGNATITTFTVTVNDTQSPSANVPANIVTTNDAGQCSAVVSFTLPAQTDNCGVATTVATPASASTFSVGATTVTVVVTDIHGNKATNTFSVTVNDTETPVISWSFTNLVLDAGANCQTLMPDVTGTNYIQAFDNCSGTNLFITQMPTNGASLPWGTNEVVLAVADQAGNTNYSTNSIVVADPPPSANVPSDIVTTNDAGQCGAVVSFTLPEQTDNCGVAGQVATPASDSTFVVGATLVTVVVTDIHGTTATNTFNVTVNDTEKPSANVPSDIVTTNDAGQCGAVVSFTLPEQTDNCGVAGQVATPASGSTFVVGATPVTVVVTDIHGNAATNTFNVTVNDTEKPSANVPANIVTTNDAGQCGAVVSFTLPAQTDNCGVATTVATPVSGSTFVVGATPVTVVVTDIHGNKATNTFNVTVNDTEKPSANVPSDIVTTNDAGQCGAVVSFTLPAQTDNCGVATTVATPASGSTFSVGATPVTVVVTDIHGNKATNSFSVTVQDTEAPVISWSFTNLVVDAGANCEALMPDVTGTNYIQAFDNCSGTNLFITQMPTNGASLPWGSNEVVLALADQAGNTNFSTNTIVVADVTPPSANVPLDIVQANDAGQCGAVVSFTLPEQTDNCGVAGQVATPVSGSTFVVGTTPVTVVVTDIHGNAATNTFNVTVNDTQPPVITNALDIVQGVDAGQQYATVAFSIGAVDNCGVQSVTANPSSGSQFPVGTNNVTVVAIDLHGNSSTNSFNVAVIALPQITSQPASRTNNAGTTASFTVVASSPAPLGYQWFKGNSQLSDGGNISGATNATLTIADVSDSDVASYTVQISNLAGNVPSSPATLTVIDPPVSVSMDPPSQTNNATTTATFTAIVSGGTAPFSYQWTKITAAATNLLSDMGNISGSTSNVLTISNVLAADQAEYVVVATNAAGSVTTNGTLVVIDPAIFVQPVSVTNALSSTAVFSVVAVGTAPLSYQWQQDGNDLPGETGSSLTLSDISDSDAGGYAVVVSNSVGQMASATATLTITHPPVIVSQPASLTLNQGATAIFNVGINGASPFTYQWTKNGASIPGATSRQLILSSVTPADAATYELAITNADGGVLSGPATLTVVVPPAITSQPVGLTNDAGATAIFSVTVSGTSPAYQWFKMTGTATNALSDGGSISGSLSNVLTLSNNLGADDGYYMLVASNQAGVASSSNAVLLVIDPIITNEPASLTVNVGNPASFSVGAYGTAPQYQWYSNGVAISGATTSTYAIGSAGPSDATGYTVVVSNQYGMVTSTPSATLTVIVPPVITGQPQSRTNNAGTTATFSVTATGSAATFQWYQGVLPISGATAASLVLTNVQDADAGSYSVVLSNASATATSDPASLTVIDGPVITGQPQNQTNNASTTATFAVTNTGTAPFSYQWYKMTVTATNALTNGGNISGSTSNVLTVASVLAADEGSYAVTISNPAGTVESSNALLVVQDPAILVQPVGVTNMEGGTVTFSVSAAGTPALSYQWYQDGAPLYGDTNGSLALTNITDSDAGSYTVVVSNSISSVTSAPALLVTVAPLIFTQPASLTILQGRSANFAVGVNGATPFSYQWLLNGTNILGATNRILSLSNVSTNNGGNYQVVVVNPTATETSKVATLTVAVLPAITVQPANVTALVGQTVNFGVAATGGALYYQWHLSDTNLPSATNSTLTLNNVSTNSAGTYSVTVTNIAGTAVSSNVTLSVYASAVPVLTIVSYANSQLTVTLTGVPTLNYSIQASSNLFNWTSLVTNASPFTFTDTNASSHKFYRGCYQ